MKMTTKNVTVMSENPMSEVFLGSLKKASKRIGKIIRNLQNNSNE